MHLNHNEKIRGHEACSGCGICTMVCPVWWETRDAWFTPHGRARALQGGASTADLAESVLSCRMCGACEPVCPEELSIMHMVRGSRLDLHEDGQNPWTRNPPRQGTKIVGSTGSEIGTKSTSNRWLLAGPELESKPALLKNVVEQLGGPDQVHLADDDGRDLAWAWEAGAPIDETRRNRFVATLAGVRNLIVIESILHRPLREWCPRVRVSGFAEALLEKESRFPTLGPRDFFVLDARAYHANHKKLVRLFSDLRLKTGCRMNLDLQRVAIPSCADSLQEHKNSRQYCETSIQWMLEDRDIDRIVVESPADLDALTTRTDIPVVHLATLAAEASAR